MNEIFGRKCDCFVTVTRKKAQRKCVYTSWDIMDVICICCHPDEPQDPLVTTNRTMSMVS